LEAELNDAQCFSQRLLTPVKVINGRNFSDWSSSVVVYGGQRRLLPPMHRLLLLLLRLLPFVFGRFFDKEYPVLLLQLVDLVDNAREAVGHRFSRFLAFQSRLFRHCATLKVR
jgi:hypothetical protein